MAALPLGQPSAAYLYENLEALATTLKADCLQLQASVAADAIASGLVLRLLRDAVAVNAAAQNIQSNATISAAVVAHMATIPGAADVATISTDFPASMAAVEALIASVVKDYPQDASGYMLDRTIAAGGVVTEINFTAAQLAEVSSAIAAWLATV